LDPAVTAVKRSLLTKNCKKKPNIFVRQEKSMSREEINLILQHLTISNTIKANIFLTQFHSNQIFVELTLSSNGHLSALRNKHAIRLQRCLCQSVMENTL
jgi:hypothetical protein